jgi:hypothetical protein
LGLKKLIFPLITAKAFELGNHGYLLNGVNILMSLSRYLKIKDESTQYEKIRYLYRYEADLNGKSMEKVRRERLLVTSSSWTE